MSSRGSQVPGWQRWIPKPIVLARVAGLGTGNVVTSNFQVPMPDSRLRVKISLLFIRAVAGGVTPAATLWLFENDDDASGGNGADGEQIALGNIEGTFSAPTAIPAAVGLNGYSREFFTAADYIGGQLRVIDTPAVAGAWVLQARYQPQIVLGDAEWQIVVSQCSPHGSLVTI
jgi:hypothetical protein